MLRPQFPDFVPVDILIANAGQGDEESFNRLRQYRETLPEPIGKDEKFIVGRIAKGVEHLSPLFAQAKLNL